MCVSVRECERVCMCVNVYVCARNRLLSGFRRLIAFIRARGCVLVQVSAGACVYVYERGPGIFPIYSDFLSSDQKQAFSRIFGKRAKDRPTDGRMEGHTDKWSDKRTAGQNLL